MELIEKMGRPANDRCTCAEVWGEDPRCILHGIETQWALENTAPEDWQNLASDMMRTIKSLDNKIATLTALIEHAGGDGVTDADEKAAWETGIRLAKDDWLKLFQAFARHRATAFAAGKAAREREIVEWLRGKIAEFEASHPDNWSLIDELTGAADAIERGEV